MNGILRRLAIALALYALIAVGSSGLVIVGAGMVSHGASAQTRGAVPGESIGNSSTADMWRAIRRGNPGRVSLPDPRTGVLIQSEGENWRAVRNGPVSTWGAWLLGGMLLALLVFFLIRGRIKIDAGLSGRLMERFNDVERFAHWVTASSFVVLGLTGLNMLYGRYVIKPMIGGEAFSTFTLWGKYVHNFMGFAFILGIVMILILWVRDNIPNGYDLVWLSKGGGLFTKGAHPPAKKFNAGQKIVFWLVVLAGGSLSFSERCASLFFFLFFLSSAVPAVSVHLLALQRYVRGPRPVRVQPADQPDGDAGDAARSDLAWRAVADHDRGHPGAHLYRLAGHGGRIRCHGNRLCRRELGASAS